MKKNAKSSAALIQEAQQRHFDDQAKLLAKKRTDAKHFIDTIYMKQDFKSMGSKSIKNLPLVVTDVSDGLYKVSQPIDRIVDDAVDNPLDGHMLASMSSPEARVYYNKFVYKHVQQPKHNPVLKSDNYQRKLQSAKNDFYYNSGLLKNQQDDNDEIVQGQHLKKEVFGARPNSFKKLHLPSTSLDLESALTLSFQQKQMITEYNDEPMQFKQLLYSLSSQKPYTKSKLKLVKSSCAPLSHQITYQISKKQQPILDISVVSMRDLLLSQ